MKYLDTEIRPATDLDLPMILEIENASFQVPWKREDILSELHSNPYANLMVIELSNQSLGLKSVCGFIDYWVTFDSATICQIAVHPDIRKEHLGSELLEDTLKDLYAKRVRTATLEVRVSNIPARSLYKKFGFKEVNIKKGYYTDGEDAIYMVKEVMNG